MKLLNSKFLLILPILFFSFSVVAQDVYVSGNGDRQGYYRTSPDGTVNNNYSTQGNTNPYTGKPGTRPRQNQINSGAKTSAAGTGEYFLVPAIVRRDPEGTAIRMNTNGAAILLLLDKNTLGGLTDGETQPLTRNTVLEIAESRFRMAIKYQPNNYLYHTNLASALYRQGKIEEALEGIGRAIELNPNNEILKNYQDAI